MYLVTGATGHVGGAVARQLHEQGRSVRALVHDASGAASLPAGIELAVGDLDDPASVAKAVTGAEAIFLMHVGTETEQTRTMIAAAQTRQCRGLCCSPPPARACCRWTATPWGPPSRLASRSCASPALA